MTDVIFDFISGSESALSLHVLIKIKEVYGHTGKGGHVLHLHCGLE